MSTILDNVDFQNQIIDLLTNKKRYDLVNDFNKFLETNERKYLKNIKNYVSQVYDWFDYIEQPIGYKCLNCQKVLELNDFYVDLCMDRNCNSYAYSNLTYCNCNGIKGKYIGFCSGCRHIYLRKLQFKPSFMTELEYLNSSDFPNSAIYPEIDE